MAYLVKTELQTHNRSNQKFKPLGIVAHATATPGATAENESRYMDTTDRKASANAFIDWNSIIVKIPPDEVSWAAGYTANHKFLNIELCEPPLPIEKEKAQQMFQEVWNRAVWFFAYTFIHNIGITKITPQNLPSHDDCSRLWHETDHTDPVGYFARFGQNMNNFRWSVQNEINNQLNGTTSTPATTPTPTRISVPLVVTANGLRCRTGPGTQYPILIYKGVPKTFNKGNIITAVGSVNGWWKLDIGGTPGYVFKKYTIERK